MEVGEELDPLMFLGAARCYQEHLGRVLPNSVDRVAEELCEMETITGDRLREIIAQYTEVPEKMAVV